MAPATATLRRRRCSNRRATALVVGGLVAWIGLCGRVVDGSSEACLAVRKFDSYGDGWDGVEMVLEGVAPEGDVMMWTGTLESGAEGTDMVCGFRRGSCVGIDVSSDGDYPSDVGGFPARRTKLVQI